MAIDKNEAKFHQMLQALADSCGSQLNEFTIGLYDKALSPYGYELVNRGLWEIFTNRRGGDRFPSIGDIKEKMGVEISSRALAVDCANLIFWTFNHWKMDYTSNPNFDEFYRENIGELPWEVVNRMGGYRAVYREWNEASDLAILRAQVRDAAQSVLDIQRATKAQNPEISGSKNAQIEGKK